MSLIEIEAQLKTFESEARAAFQSSSDLKELEGMRQKGRRSSFDDLPKRLRARWPDPTPVRPTSQAKDLRQKIFLVARIFSV